MTRRVSMGRVFGVGLRDELRAIVRGPASLFFAILLPVGFFALFSLVFGYQSARGLSAGTAMVAVAGVLVAVSYRHART